LKLAFAQCSVTPKFLTVPGAETVSLIEILGFDGSNDFVSVANASQPAGGSDIERVTPIPFTCISFMLGGIIPLPLSGGVSQEANPFGGSV
jgi:hypothetical protein